ncbi:MAG: MoxR family ATPase [Candidatus Eremiobacteraeota bacterium]|nr:MoxR family ATPase [Candidatus Eremiobacteraeota bacterium]MCW5870431.1 MoxR family ATPase [Candidatus Eremiobacteraeota bacterium]
MPATVQEFGQKLCDQVEQVILGKRQAVQLVAVALLCEGHLLVDDVPGVGKTMLSRAIARSLDCSFARVQCTPDLLPGDLVGVSVFHPGQGEFRFRPGPIHHQVVLADEINRATPKTQSALLECMEERQATVDGQTYPMPRPFLVLATQNPVEFEGTFPLPEAQLDRFLVRLHLGYPDLDSEVQMLETHAQEGTVDRLQPLVTADQLQALKESLPKIRFEPKLRKFLVELVQATRRQAGVRLGASPRGSLALYRSSLAWAALQGRDYVIPDDIQHMVVPTLAHRLVGAGGFEQAEAILQRMLEQHPVPL